MRKSMIRSMLFGVITAVILPAALNDALAGTYDLVIGKTTVNVSGKEKMALSINGQTPGPTLRFTEGEKVTIRVKNTLDEDSSIHWHGLILPYRQDGVPGISFPGIKPGESFTYSFTVKQNGTYWYHSHSGLQEQEGVYGAITIKSAKREPFRYTRDYVIMLSDSHDTPAEQIFSNLKKRPDYYNNSRRTVATFFDDVAKNGLSATLSDRRAWGTMRMSPTDIADVSGYSFLINGKNATQNWTGLFKPRERIRLRFINASAMTYFDVRIPGLKMTVVQADGTNVIATNVDEFRIAVAETYDVIVRPKDDKAYSILAESMARSGFARATLSPRKGMVNPLPKLRQRPLLTMADMGMDHGDMAGMAGMDHSKMKGMSKSGMKGMDHSKMKMAPKADPFYALGSGLTPKAANGGKFLSYADLKAQKPRYKLRPASREIEFRLTGNMERYFWSINDLKYSEAEPVRLKLGERVRFKFVNETMMTHPMHLHGMWSILDNGSGKRNPVKHTVSVAPGTTLYIEVEADAVGEWAFHCHLMYHMASGMFRKVIVEAPVSAEMSGTGGTVL